MVTEKLDTEIRREQIIQVALQLLGEGGIQGLNMAAIARRLGLVSSAIYRHFRSKDEVLNAVVDLIHSQMQANFQQARQEATGVLDCLEKLLMLHVQFIRENKAFPRIVCSDEMAYGDADRKTKLYQALQYSLGRLVQIIQEGQQSGEIRPELDPETTGMLFVGLFQPGAIFWKLSDGQFDITKHAKRAWQLFVTAVAVQ